MDKTHFIDKEPNKYEALTELRKLQIQSMNENELLNVIDRFESAWSLKTSDFSASRNLGYRQFIHPDNFDEFGNPIPQNPEQSLGNIPKDPDVSGTSTQAPEIKGT